MAEGRGESQGKGKRKVEYDGSLWPVKKPPSLSNVVYAKSLDDWNSVEEIQIGETRFPFFSNKRRSDILLSHSTFRIWYGSNVDNLIVPTNGDVSRFAKCRLLREYVGRLLNLPSDFVNLNFPRCYPVVMQDEEAEGRAPADEPDSDDEQVADPPTVKPFKDEELVIIQHYYTLLCEAYQVGRGVGFSNAAGKGFVVALVHFLKLVDTCSPFKCLFSTATGPDQPGAMSIRWVTSGSLNSRSGPPKLLTTVRDRYSDVVVYDIVNQVTLVVVEIKPTEEDASQSQHNEEMGGLWDRRQRAMLGFELCGPNLARPKVLIQQEGRLNLYYLKELDLCTKTGQMKLTSLLLAFMTQVNYLA